MPNWCLNTVVVEHNDPNLVDRFVEAYNSNKTCNEFVPKPESIGDEWYDWCVNNWGTKWDFGLEDGEIEATKNKAVCKFSSAWAPPIGLYNELVELGYSVKATYFEAGMGFCGVWENGHDDYVEFQDNPEKIPKIIWENYSLNGVL